MTALPRLEIVAIGDRSVSAGYVLPLREHLQSFLRRPIKIGRPLDLSHFDRDLKIGPDVLMEAFMARLQSRESAEPGWVLAITSHELNDSSENCTFGETAEGVAWAAVSTARLTGRFAGRAEVFERLHKEVLHALGHLAGVEHCTQPRCIMRPSASLTEIDRKRIRFCLSCERRFFGR